jgi:hypothetical protein
MTLTGVSINALCDVGLGYEEKSPGASEGPPIAALSLVALNDSPKILCGFNQLNKSQKLSILNNKIKIKLDRKHE